MVELIDNSDFKGLKQVTNATTFDQKGPTPDGLYSETIFGTNLKETSTIFAYIDLGTMILHPDVYSNINKLDPIFKKIVDPSFDTKATLVSGMLQESPSGKRGIGWLHSIWDQIDFDKYQKPGIKDQSYKFKELKKEKIFITKWLVIPPLFRPYIEERGIKKEDEITGLYKDIMRVANSQKGLNPYIDKILDANSKQDLVQLKVNALHDHIINLVNKAEGFQEQKLVGKRQNNVARLVANASPRIPLDSIGLPWHYLLGLFDMHVIAEIQNSPQKEEILKILELPINTQPSEYGQYFDYIARNAEVFVASPGGEKKRQVLIEVLMNIFEKNPKLTVMMKRDPAWDKNSYHSLKPIIITDNAYHVVTNSMIYKPIGGDSFTTKVCGITQEAYNNILFEKETAKSKFQIKLVSKDKPTKVTKMKSMQHFAEKLFN